jgi:urea transport system substrate-binding protein
MTTDSSNLHSVAGLRFPFLTPLPGALGTFGPYTVHGVLGSGGMGHVFEADDPTLGRTVALKVLRPELAGDPENRARFLREARAAASLASDHVVTIHQVGERDGLPFIAMQRLRGESLHARMNRPPKLSLEESLSIARQIAVGLAAAHSRGMVHRDIKPANLWLEEVTGRLKILDFGLARFAQDANLTATGFVVGTPNYMAPEQASGAELDGRADLFSLGCVLYEMLTGSLPFPGNSAMAVMMSLASVTPISVTRVNPAVPAAVSDFVMRLLAKKPIERVSSAAATVAALDALLAGKPVPIDSPETTRLPQVSGLGDTERTLKIDPVRRFRPNRWLLISGALAVASAAAFGLSFFLAKPVVLAKDPVHVGILHSATGVMEQSENPVIDATQLAIDELNAVGGVLGRPITAIVRDGKSTPEEFRKQAESLCSEQRVAAIFGCWTSASRKEVKPIVERNNNLLFYPVQYEGLEQSPNIVYLGPAPNQQLLPAIDFLVQDLKKKSIYLIGSDYVFPRSANEIALEDLKKRWDITVSEPDYLLLTEKDPARIAAAVAKIKKANPDAILNTINGSANAFFYAELRRQGLASGFRG